MGKTFSTGLLTNGVFQDASNNIGIGAAPSGSYKLEVTGTAKVSSTLLLGGALTGTSATFSGLITYSGTSQILNAASGTTGYLYQYLANTTGAAYFGLERSTGGGLFTGSSAYATVLGSTTATSLQFGTNGIIRATIDSSGNVGIGSGSTIYNGGGFGRVLSIYEASTVALSLVTSTQQYQIGIASADYRIYDVTGSTYRFVIKASTGNVVIGDTASNGYKLQVNGAFYSGLNAVTAWAVYTDVTPTSGNLYGNVVSFSNSSPNNSASYMYYGGDSSGARFIVRGNGGISNYQGNDTNLSDLRLKKDILPLESYWEKFKAIEIVKFKYIDQTHDDYNIGVIAQQVESVAPEFVDVDGWGLDDKINDGTPLKSIYTEDLHTATIKVLQEAMTKIEELNERLNKAGL